MPFGVLIPSRDDADHAPPPMGCPEGPTIVVQGVEPAEIPKEAGVESDFST